jgi:hypothetical protein
MLFTISFKTHSTSYRIHLQKQLIPIKLIATMTTCSLADIERARRMYYNVYKIGYAFSSAANDYVLFIETNGPQSGCMMQVSGDIQQGMQLHISENVDPYDSDYLNKELVGRIESTELPRARGICRAIDLPGIQMDYLGRKIDQSKPYYRSQEWVDNVIEALRFWVIFAELMRIHTVQYTCILVVLLPLVN